MRTPYERLKKLVGRGVAEIDTPAAVVDLDAMHRNLNRMAEFARKHGIRWRPHAKMHKSSALARLQMQAGACGVCVQKTAEAEVMAAGGVHDIYITNQVIAPVKLARVAALAHRLAAEGGRLSIAVDSGEGVHRLAQAMNQARAAGGVPAVIDVFVEIDVGQGRCGLPPGPRAVALVHEIRRHAPLRFAGLQAYHGGAQHLRAALERREAIAAVVQKVQVARKLIEAEGVPVPLVTGAGTGTLVCEAASGAFGEVQAGSFLFMDADYAANERDPAQPLFEQALFVRTQVISVAATHAVCDAGHKSHSIDSGMPTVLAARQPGGLSFRNGGDEHGILVGPRLPALGEHLWLIPGHCDPTVNLHDHLVAVSGGLAEGRIDRILRVDARGAST
ncbi:DSD1 family PLP-dependent enzyme [Ramlibacter sp. AW1]|uniref:DSD1 family PLP-dependent enzyme n=1 Tax=Ramlibacter aurantiacus TaxID=2801330 RepID=A0A936ZK46_9BURK|nr:DSD1 family PLP-dependent enzyme [Ramlibacter aurantiacus]MBL0421678.1 DSD1 family PLP-dependent enzyme [Ramlibacter aurantiacus]